MSKYVLVLFIFSSTLIEAQITFQKTFGNNGYQEESYCVQPTSDGGYIITGTDEVPTPVNSKVFLIRTDSNGDTLWMKNYDDSLDQEGRSVQQTSDGGFIIAGATQTAGTVYSDVYLIKTDSIGNLIWSNAYGGVSYDNGYSVEQTFDGGYIVAGETATWLGDFYLLKTDAAGNLVWTKLIGGQSGEHANCVRQTRDSGYIAVGISYSFGAGNEDVFLIRTDLNGDIIWSKTYGGSLYDRGFYVAQTSDDGFIVSGYSNSFGLPSQEDLYLIKTDENGDTLWTKTVPGITQGGGSLFANCIEQTFDSGYIITGGTGSPSSYIYLMKTDSLANITWTTTYIGGGTEDVSNFVRQTIDSGYIISAISTGFGNGNRKPYLIKTDKDGNTSDQCNEGTIVVSAGGSATQVSNAVPVISLGNTMVTVVNTIVTNRISSDSLFCTSTGVSEMLVNGSVLLSPNPASSAFTIHSSLEFQNTEVEIFNILGEKVDGRQYKMDKK